MDKLMNNHWFMKIIALLLALLLYLSVDLDSDTVKTTSNGNSVVRYETETVTDIPVNVYYDDRNTIVTGVPEQVDVTLEGPKSILQPIKLQRDFEVYVDLTNLKLGTHQVRLNYRNLSDKIDVNIAPQVIKVNIEEKVSKKFPVEANVNAKSIREGYIAEQPIIRPNKVNVIGAKSEIAKIAEIRAVFEIDDVHETIIKQAGLVALDRNSKRLDVQFEPSEIEVTIRVASPSKKLPFKLNHIGTLPGDISIKSIEVSPKEIEVFGPRDVLNKLSQLENIKFDVSQLDSSKTVHIDVPVPKGAEKVKPERISVKVEVEKKAKKLVRNVPLSMVQRLESLSYELINPNSGKIDVEVIGAVSLLNNLGPKDIKAYVNVSELKSGQHEVPIKVIGPENLTFTLSLQQAAVAIANNSVASPGNVENNRQSLPAGADSQEKNLSDREQSHQDLDMNNAHLE